MLKKEAAESLEPLLFLLIVEGISDRYTRAEREYIFALISEKKISLWDQKRSPYE